MISELIIIEKAKQVEATMATMSPQEQISFLQSLFIAKLVQEVNEKNDKAVLKNLQDNLAAVRTKMRKQK